MPKLVSPTFVHPNPSRNKVLEIGWLRDPLPALLLVDALRSEGFELGPIIMNHPGPVSRAQPPAVLHPIPIPLEAGDLTLWLTRPPLDDPEFDEPKKVRRAYTVPEQIWLDAWRPWFSFLTRSEMVLAPPLRALLPPGFEERRHAFVYQRTGSWYRVLFDEKGHKRTPKGHRTPAFILRTPDFTPGGPGMLSVFAFDSTVAVVFAHLLRTRHPEWLRDDGITMVELSGKPIPARPTSLDFADAWSAEIVLKERF